MKFRSTAVLAATLATAPAFAGFVSTATLSMSGIAGTGGYAVAGNTWKVDFFTDADLSQPGTNADFGNWLLVVTASDGKTWSMSSAETAGGVYRNVSNGRVFTVTLADGFPISGDGDLDPAPTVLSLRYTTPRINGVWQSMENALVYSGSSTTPASQRGMLSVISGTGPSASVIEGYFNTTIPAPGAAALIGAAGLLTGRRRR